MSSTRPARVIRPSQKVLDQNNADAEEVYLPRKRKTAATVQDNDGDGSAASDTDSVNETIKATSMYLQSNQALKANFFSGKKTRMNDDACDPQPVSTSILPDADTRNVHGLLKDLSHIDVEIGEADSGGRSKSADKSADVRHFFVNMHERHESNGAVTKVHDCSICK